MIRRTLEAIGRHPVAGSYLIAQLVVLVWVAYEMRTSGPTGPLSMIPVLFFIAALQFPASFVIGIGMHGMPLSTALDAQESGLLLVWLFVLAGFANSVFWIYAGPRLSRRIESRWPFERTYFRRPPYGAGRHNNELQRTRPAQATEPRR